VARTLVVFGSDLPLDRRAYAWPQEAIRQLPREADLLEQFRIAIQQPRREAVEFAVAVLRLA
jgi:hypothetical protein